MAQITQFLKIALTILLISHPAFSLKCYICNSGLDGDCNVSPTPKKYLIDCSASQQQTSTEQAQPQQDQTTTTHDNHETQSNETSPVPASLLDNHSEDEQLREEQVHGEKEDSLDRESRSVGENTQAENKEAPFFVMEAVKLPKEASYCRKISYHIPEQVNGPNSTLPKSVRVVRSCGYIHETNKDAAAAAAADKQAGCKWIGTEGIQMDECTCFGDGCNSGYLFNPLTLQTMIFLSVISAGYFYIL